SGGTATMIVWRSKIKEPTRNKTTMAPKIPVKAIKIVLHCFFNSLIESKVPILVISRNINSVATTSGIPAVTTFSVGKNVQYTIKNKTAQTKIDGTHAFVRIAT